MLFIISFILFCLFFLLDKIFYKRRVRCNFPIKKKRVEISCEMLLEFMLICIKNGSSIPTSLYEISRLSPDLSFLEAVAKKLTYGDNWGEAWNSCPKKYINVKRCLQLAWSRGASPSKAIEAELQKISQERNITIKNRAEKLSIKIVIPLGLCFLPSFICLTLVPILIHLFGSISL